MKIPERKTHKKSSAIAVFLLLFIALTWSIGSIGKGIWQLSHSQTKTAKNRQNTPDFASVPNVTAGVFNYGGSTAWASLRLAVDSVIQSERSEIQFRYVQPPNQPPGSSPGIKMLLEGQIAFVQSSRPLRPQEYRLAKQKGLKLIQVPVAVDGIAVAVHPKLDLPGLTLSQLQAIYTGKISNWQEVGGADIPITAYSRPASAGGTVDFFASKILQGRKFGSNVEFVPTTTQALRKLARDSGGIYYGSAPAIVTQCSIKPLPIGKNDFVPPYQKPLIPASECPQKRNRLNFKALRNAQYPLTYYLYVVYLQNEPNEPQIGEAYANFLLTPQGQKLIAKTGFVPLD